MSRQPRKYLDDAEFEGIRDLLYRHAGIVLSDSKRTMVAGRLGKRVGQLGCATFGEYLELLGDDESGPAEIVHMTNCLTTNKTAFFRELHHFEILKIFLEKMRKEGRKKLRIWSAGCSTGQEPYTIAMTILETIENARQWDIQILASDIDTEVLERAKAGLYPKELLEDVPPASRAAWFHRTADPDVVALDDKLKQLITFRQINLIERPWPIRARFDIIFCRNVTIYFDRETQRGIYDAQAKLLLEHGLFFAGHSENLHWLGDILSPVGGTVYRPASGPRTAQPLSPRSVPRTLTRTPPVLTSAHPEKKTVAITIGEVFASAEPFVVNTTLGSCVAACVFDPDAGVGGMNHFMLPDGPHGDDILPTRYGIHAMELLIAQLVHHGADRRRLVAKVFGAAHVLRGLSRHVPDGNARFVLEFLEAKGIPVVAQRLGGDLPVQIYFHTDSGKALLRAVDRNTDAVRERDEIYRRALAERAAQGKLR